MTANISRRRLIESSIVGTAALAGATSAFASKPVAKWDETVDIIVVGSGFAGLAAAKASRHQGLRRPTRKRYSGGRQLHELCR